MLEKILLNYSEGDLIGILGKNSLSFYENLFQSQIEKNNLVKAIVLLHGYSIVSNKNSRDKLIERMSEEQVDLILSDLKNRASLVQEIESHVDKYTILQKLSDGIPEDFTYVLGYGDSTKLIKEHSKSVQGIKAIKPYYPLYPYQQEIVVKVSNLIRTPETDRCIVHLPTGAGKTRAAMNIVSEHIRDNKNTLVLWLADTAELCTQAASEFENSWMALGNRNIKIYSYYSDTNISLGGIDDGFLVAGLQKMNSTSKGDLSILYQKIRKHVSLIVFDEAHKAIAPTYSKTISDMIKDKEGVTAFLLGLTATPGRKIDADKGEDSILAEFFNSKKVTMQVKGYESPIKYLVDKEYLANATFINIDYKGEKILLAENFSSENRGNEIKKSLSKDDNRNIKLLEAIKKEHRQGSSIIIFSCNLEHSKNIATMLAFNNIRAHTLDSKSDNIESRRIKIAEYSSGKVRVIINYNILTAGFDAPKTNIAIIARPTDSLVQYSQMVGRAMRGPKSKGNKECRIYTVRDDIPAFTSVIKAFEHWDEYWEEI